MSHSNENVPESLGERLRRMAWVGHWSATAVIIPAVAVSYVGFLLRTFS